MSANVAALVEGNSMRATSRMTGAALNTVMKLQPDLCESCESCESVHLGVRGRRGSARGAPVESELPRRVRRRCSRASAAFRGRR